jgi:Tannase-like family of unknown function (DUF6351)
VSGGDALVQVVVPRKVAPADVIVKLGRSDVTAAFSAGAGRTLVGLVEGLENGDNTLTVSTEGGKRRVPRARLTLTNHPVGGPIFSGPQQQPFVCTTARARFDGRPLLGQPLVDNEDQVGIPVAAEDAQGGYPQDGRGYPTAAAQIVGWSKDCAADTNVGYVYGTTGGQFRWLDDPAGPLPADIATVTTLDDQLYGLLGYQVMDRDPASPAPALTECRASWFGLTPLTLNPTFTNVNDIDKLAQGTAGVEWTHWGDTVNIYGRGDDGFARVPWDNVGVQYGLQALVDGVITPADFLDLNAQVGSWKNSAEMVPEGFPFQGAFSPQNFDPWSSRNMNLSPDGGATPALRREGNPDAMRAAYTSGMEFQGDIDIPIIDWRHYLEDELDMHHSHQSFATRQRMLNADGDASNQVIWFTDARAFARAFDQTPLAFEVIDEWMANIAAHPERSVARNKPERAVDSCFDTNGNLIASGRRVWDGVLDDRPDGACTQHFPIYSSSRRQAGGPYEGGVWKCQVQSVDRAIRRGLYGDWRPTAAEKARLEQIFADGVCDYAKPDAGKPRGH